MRHFALIFILYASNHCIASTAFEWHGDIGTQQAYGIDAHSLVLSSLEANFSAQHSGKSCNEKFAVRLQTENQLTPNRTYSSDVRQAEVACRQGDWLWSIGRQAVVWGKVDGFRILDAVHLFDYREFILVDREASRLSLAMLRVEKNFNEQNTLQFLLIPEQRLDILLNASDRFSEIWPQLNWDKQAGTESHSSKINTPQIGMKWERIGQQFSYTFNVLNRWSP